MFTITAEMKQKAIAVFKEKNAINNPFMVKLFCVFENQINKITEFETPRLYYNFLKDNYVNPEVLMPKEQFMEMYAEIEKEKQEREQSDLKIKAESAEHARQQEIVLVDNSVIEAGVSLMHKQCCFKNYVWFPGPRNIYYPCRYRRLPSYVKSQDCRP